MWLGWLFGGWASVLGKAGELLDVASWLSDRSAEKSRVTVEIIKAHRELWNGIRAMPGSQGLFDRERDLVLYPRTEDETHALRLVLVHFSWVLGQHRAGLYDLPRGLAADVRNFFSYPVRADAWRELRRFQDKDVVSFVERALRD